MENRVYVVITAINGYMNIDRVYSSWWAADCRAEELWNDPRYWEREIFLQEQDVW